MHDILLALAFVGMVIAPAIVSATGTVQPADSTADGCMSHEAMDLDCAVTPAA